MATNGFDVWLNNCRGNVYSRKHRFLKTNDPRFWDFSFHEIGYYDIAAVIDFILRRTGCKSLNYIGHSMGSTALYVLLSSRPEYNQKIRLGITLAPVVYYRTPGDPLLRIAVQMAPKIAIMLKLMNRYELLPRRKPTVDFLKNLCLSSQAAHDFCTNVYFALFGQGASFFNQVCFAQRDHFKAYFEFKIQNFKKRIKIEVGIWLILNFHITLDFQQNIFM